MRAFPLLVAILCVGLPCTSAVAQDRGDAPRSSAAPAATTGAAPREPSIPAPVGHRQPKAADAPSQDTTQPQVSPYDQKIDRDLNICRGC
jgi:hypothetical protein